MAEIQNIKIIPQACSENYPYIICLRVCQTVSRILPNGSKTPVHHSPFLIDKKSVYDGVSIEKHLLCVNKYLNTIYANVTKA